MFFAAEIDDWVVTVCVVEAIDDVFLVVEVEWGTLEESETRVTEEVRFFTIERGSTS